MSTSEPSGPLVSFDLDLEVDVAQTTVMPAKSDCDALFCLQSYQGLIIDRSLVY